MLDLLSDRCCPLALYALQDYTPVRQIKLIAIYSAFAVAVVCRVDAVKQCQREIISRLQSLRQSLSAKKTRL